MMRKLRVICAVCLTATLIAKISLADGVCIKPVPCEGIVLGKVKFMCCTWDHGCWLNPFEPDNQWWCDEITVILCGDGGTGGVVTASEECGPCCELEPLPVPPVDVFSAVN